MRRAHDAIADEVALEIARKNDVDKWIKEERERLREQATANNPPDQNAPKPNEEEWPFFQMKDYRAYYLRKPFWEQASNLRAAEHKYVTVQTLGLIIEAPKIEDRFPVDFSQIGNNEKTVAAKMEHHRWMAERLLMGWSYSSLRSDHPPTRPSMCAQKHLTEEDWLQDYEQVEVALNFLGRRRSYFNHSST